MSATEVVFKLSKEAMKLLKSGQAELTKGGIRDVNTGRILKLAKPVLQTVKTNKEMLQDITKGLQQVQALSWVNTVLNLANLGVSVAGFYLTLTRMESLHGEIHEFIESYKSDKTADHLEKYKEHLLNITSQLAFLQNRYSTDDYDKKMFIIREADIEKQINETYSFLERIKSQYEKKEIPDKLACQILFTLTPAYAQMVNEYCYQYYCAHNMIHPQFDSWKSILEQINSESFQEFMKRQMTFSIQYVELSPVRRKDVLTVAFGCIDEIQENLTQCAEAFKLAPPDELIPMEELLSQHIWNNIKGTLKAGGSETKEEFFSKQIMQMAISDDGEEEIYIPVRMAAYGG